MRTLIFVAAAIVFTIIAYKKQTLLPVGLALLSLGLAL